MSYGPITDMFRICLKSTIAFKDGGKNGTLLRISDVHHVNSYTLRLELIKNHYEIYSIHLEVKFNVVHELIQ